MQRPGVQERESAGWGGAAQMQMVNDKGVIKNL